MCMEIVSYSLWTNWANFASLHMSRKVTSSWLAPEYYCVYKNSSESKCEAYSLSSSCAKSGPCGVMT